MEPANIIWDALLGVGTALTLTVIVMIALAINALALFYVSSAVVVLERFARTVRRPLWVLVFGTAVALGTAYLSLEVEPPYELSDASDSRASFFLMAFLGAAGLTAFSIGACWLALRFLSSMRLGTLTLTALGIGAAALVGATGRLPFALAGPVSVAVVLLAVRVRRFLRKNAGPRPGNAEIQLRWLGGALLIGPVLAVALPEPDPRVAGAGGGLLQLVWALIVMGLLPLAAAGLVEMRRSAEWFIAIRYLVAQRRQVYISAITLLCIGGIAAGVWLIVTVLSVMNGFERAWRDQIVGDLAHFTVHSGLGRFSGYEPVLEVVGAASGVEAVSPYLDAEGMVRGDDGRLFGVRLRGDRPGDCRSGHGRRQPAGGGIAGRAFEQ